MWAGPEYPYHFCAGGGKRRRDRRRVRQHRSRPRRTRRPRAPQPCRRSAELPPRDTRSPPSPAPGTTGAVTQPPATSGRSRGVPLARFGNIGGTTAPSYSPTVANVGMYIRVAVAETNSGGTATFHLAARQVRCTSPPQTNSNEDCPLLPLRAHLHAPEDSRRDHVQTEASRRRPLHQGRHHAHARQGQRRDRDHALDRPDHCRHRG